MRQELERALEAIESACKRIDELKAENKTLKEALAQPEQEPVAIVHRNEYNEYRLEPHDNFDIKSIPFNIDVPLFKPPQRTWVGLTDEEIKQGESKEEQGYGFIQGALWAEAKLKEKNNG